MRRLGTTGRGRVPIYCFCRMADPPFFRAFGTAPEFPSRRKRKSARAFGPPTGRPILSRPWPSPLSDGRLRLKQDCCYPSLSAGAGLHAFVMFIAPILTSFVAHRFRVREAGHPCDARPAEGRRLEGSRGAGAAPFILFPALRRPWGSSPFDRTSKSRAVGRNKIASRGAAVIDRCTLGHHRRKGLSAVSPAVGRRA
jgi:hypothetical protein